MSGFTGNTDQPSVDMLTWISFLESNDNEKAVIECHVRPLNFRADWRHYAPLLYPRRFCLKCVSETLTSKWGGGYDKLALMEGMRNGLLVVFSLPLTPLQKCARCEVLPNLELTKR